MLHLNLIDFFSHNVGELITRMFNKIKQLFISEREKIKFIYLFFILISLNLILWHSRLGGSFIFDATILPKPLSKRLYLSVIYFLCT